MLEWLVPISLFWALASLYIGGWPVTVEGGSGFRQVIGLVASFVLFLVVWAVLRAVIGGAGIVTGVVVPTAIVCLALPAIIWVGFRIMGVKVTLSKAATH